MKNFLSKILISVATGVIFFSAPLVAAAQPLITVEFQNSPLFSEANFLPSQSVTKWIKVTNVSGSTQKIVIKALNVKSVGDLSDFLDLEIKENTTVLSTSTLAHFFTLSEQQLSDLLPGKDTQYDLSITFNPNAGNDLQNAILGFDLAVGTSGGGETISDGGGTYFSSEGGGGGGNGPPGGEGMVIYNELAVFSVGGDATFTWNTNHLASSRVIYAKEGESHILDLNDDSGDPPLYGYTRTTPEYDMPFGTNGTTTHAITLTGLEPGATYYWRVVSRGSFAVSREYMFRIPLPGEVAQNFFSQTTEGSSGAVQGGEESLGGGNGTTTEGENNNLAAVGAGQEENGGGGLGSMIAGVFGAIADWWWLILLIIILIIIWLIKRSLDKKEQ